jgi:hypothetical protein
VIEEAGNSAPEDMDYDQFIRLGVEFDIKVLEAIIKNRDTVSFPMFVVSIRRMSSDTELKLHILEGFSLQKIEISSTIFYPESFDTFTMRSYFKEFNNQNLICSIYEYRLLSSIKFDPLYKCIAYVLLLKKHRARLFRKLINDMRDEGENGIYPELKKLMDIVLGSQYEMRKRRHLPVIKEGRSAKKPFRQLSGSVSRTWL